MALLAMFSVACSSRSDCWVKVVKIAAGLLDFAVFAG
jgi:hypothetical protein